MSPLVRTSLLARRFRLAVVATVPALLAACSGDASSILNPSSIAPDSASASRSPKPAPAPAPAPAPVTTSNALAGARFWVDPYSHAASTANAWRSARPADAAQMDKIASQPVTKWIGNWNTNVQADVNAAVSMMTASGALPVLVAYNIPQRDCGGLSGGNTTSITAYRAWITAFANGLAGRRAAVILEPDALAGMDCLSAADQQTRLDLMKFAVQTLTATGNVAVYLDAGNPHWKSAATMAQRLIGAGIAQAQGFSLNVSNFFTTGDNVGFGTQLSPLVGGKHFVIDTGRNGLGATADAQWCNPAGRAIGNRPTSSTGNTLVDAYLWIKTPGESDGACSGNPSAGAWMPEYALGLAQRG